MIHFCLVQIQWSQLILITAQLRQCRIFRQIQWSQLIFTTEQFSGLTGKLVSLNDALDGCERILQDEFTNIHENAFYMIGKIEEATHHKY